MTRTQQTKQRAELEQVLLSYTEMCYSVAFTLTRDPRQAQELATYALTSAWRTGDKVNSGPAIKQDLLKALRERFLLHYRPSLWSLSKAATSEGDAAETAPQGLEREVEGDSLRASDVARNL